MPLLVLYIHSIKLPIAFELVGWLSRTKALKFEHGCACYNFFTHILHVRFMQCCPIAPRHSTNWKQPAVISFVKIRCDPFASQRPVLGSDHFPSASVSQRGSGSGGVISNDTTLGRSSHDQPNCPKSRQARRLCGTQGRSA